MQIQKINESFDTLIHALEFYHLLCTEVVKFKSLDTSLVLKWGSPYSVEGTIFLRSEGQKEVLEDVLQNLNK